MKQQIYCLIVFCLFLQNSLCGLQTAQDFFKKFNTYFTKNSSISEAKKAVLIDTLTLLKEHANSLSSSEKNFKNKALEISNSDFIKNITTDSIEEKILFIKFELSKAKESDTSQRLNIATNFLKIFEYLHTLNISQLSTTVQKIVTEFKTTKKEACKKLLQSTVTLIKTITQKSKQEQSPLTSLLIDIEKAAKKPKISKPLMQQIRDFVQSKWMIGLLTTYVTTTTISQGFEQAAELVATQPSLYRILEVPILGSVYFADIEGKASLLTSQTISNLFFDNFWTNLLIISSPYSAPYIWRGIWGTINFFNPRPTKPKQAQPLSVQSSEKPK